MFIISLLATNVMIHKVQGFTKLMMCFAKKNLEVCPGLVNGLPCIPLQNPAAKYTSLI